MQQEKYDVTGDEKIESLGRSEVPAQGDIQVLQRNMRRPDGCRPRKPWPTAWAHQASATRPAPGALKGAEQSWADQRSPLEPGSWPSLTLLTPLTGARPGGGKGGGI